MIQYIRKHYKIILVALLPIIVTKLLPRDIKHLLVDGNVPYIIINVVFLLWGLSKIFKAFQQGKQASYIAILVGLPMVVLPLLLLSNVLHLGFQEMMIAYVAITVVDQGILPLLAKKEGVNAS